MARVEAAAGAQNQLNIHDLGLGLLPQPLPSPSSARQYVKTYRYKKIGGC